MEGTPLEFTVGPHEEQMRLDQFVRARIPGISRGSVRRLLEMKHVLVEGRSQPKGHRVRSGQQVVVAAAARSESPRPQPELELEILEERPDLVVINKPATMACHPLVPGETDTVANALVARYPECAAASPMAREGGLVHRLDWSTSGLLLAARNRQAYGQLRGMFSSSQVVKTYLALVFGEVSAPGRIDQALHTMPGDRTRMKVVTEGDPLKGQHAESEYAPVQALGAFTLVRVTCRTGRRHQVRVHMAAVGHPLVGDTLYGGPQEEGVEGAMLHAHHLQLTSRQESFTAPLPADRLEFLEQLGAQLELSELAIIE